MVEYPIGHARRRQDGIPKLVDNSKSISRASSRLANSSAFWRFLSTELAWNRCRSMSISTCTPFKQTAVRRKFNRRALCLSANFISVRLTNRSSSGPSRPGVLTGRRPLRNCSITAIRRLPVGFVKANQLVPQRYRPLAGETARGAGTDCRLFGNKEERTFTFRQLHDEVNAVASTLRSLGVQRGDRVLVYMPMIAEAHLLCWPARALRYSLGGVWGFASHSVAARIDDAKPVLIVSADAGARGGKIIPYKKLLDDAISQAQHQPRHVLLVDRGLAKMRARQRAGCRFRVVAPSTHRRAGTGGVAGIQRNLLHLTPPARPANERRAA
ncbi:AMP-binding protein [Escherichia coli]